MPDTSTSETDVNELKASAAQIRFEQLTLELASEQRFGGPDAVSSEVEIMDEVAEIVKLSWKNR